MGSIGSGMPDVLVDDELPCPMVPWKLPGGLFGAKVLRHLENGSVYWACCHGALVALWSVLLPRPVCGLGCGRLPVLPTCCRMTSGYWER